MDTRRKKASSIDQFGLNSRISDLPNHILTEILCRLPIKTLVAVKLVCKSWLDLISGDTHLAESHHRRSPTELLLRSPFSPTLYFGNIQFHNNSVSGFKLSLLCHIPKFSVRNNNTINFRNTNENCLCFVNSCNGLLCFCDIGTRRSMYALICNPVTGEFITVPGTKIDKNVKCSAYGLGFSRKENRFKLLRVMCRTELHPGTTLKVSRNFAEICTFEEGSSWRDLGDCPYLIYGHRSVSPYFVFLEGKLHFHCMTSRGTDAGIGLFDFDNEQFGKVQLPPQWDFIFTREVAGWIKRIGELGGCLCLSRYESSESVEIWVLKEYDVRNSWIKTFSVAKNAMNSTWEHLHIPLKQPEVGETLMIHDDQTLVSYNPVTGDTRTIGHSYDCHEVIAYTPTLLLLKDALAGYEARVYNVKSRLFDLGVEVDATPHWWQPMEENHKSESSSTTQESQALSSSS